MNTLLSEILVSLAAAALFSLIIGWLLRSVKARGDLRRTEAKWEAKTAELELRARQETEQLEDQLQTLGQQSKTLAQNNRSLTESLRETEISVQKARSDSIELNRQQAETQERLQRIIKQKEEEIKIQQLNMPVAGMAAAAAAIGVSSSDEDTTEAQIKSLSAKREAWERESQKLADTIADEQDTIAIDPADVPSAEAHDQTVRIDSSQVPDGSASVTPGSPGGRPANDS